MLATQRHNFSDVLSTPRPFNGSTMMQKTKVGHRFGNSTNSPTSPTAAGITMTLGIVFNVVALIILAKAYTRFRRRSKATFLLFASSLVATDLAGHVINGALVLRRYTAGIVNLTDPLSDFSGNLKTDPDVPCLFLGCCMVFFGLSPLFLGCAMAAERCLGVSRPLLHARLVTTARTKIALALIWLSALSVALLPFFSLGAYTYQYPGSWCFIRVMEGTQSTDLVFVTLFTGLALSSLAIAFVCNTISGLTLMRARLKKKSSSQRSSARSHDTEMVVQLVGIMVASTICWSPLLVFGLMSATRSYNRSLDPDRNTYKDLMVTGVRMATCNQILDPWVYILLRRAILKKIYRITKRQASLRGSMLRSFRWDVSSFQNSEKKNVKV
ncbi:prostaglandin E2 receptor EP1 subtype-like isoform X1 [Corythoichthys intestinalis]|uniref:prostaglandin E2 receptor EP1 subtype-like isoform X1 n=1 Tax=Corythoichthys intestinalis TaxID=161448 RepID=UPI0025A4D3AF|nr:prostaglandin E2 receptor EP1 subtype-like isoform X1 [Corythoichthys intestinalis]XP_057716533.1 prostaglandin E2 receptor EP1 subtype-like isoform X1 [Corythoichthys intestinalis]XP_061805450.1 prostaglandin E2 receptor EP1 subtype-like [Nerophis lumbriciformis]